MLLVLALLAAIICIFTLGAGCNEILDQLIAQACPGAGLTGTALADGEGSSPAQAIP